MLKSTASADPAGRPEADCGHYLWDGPQKSPAIELNLDMVDRLEREVVETFRAVTKRGSEVGGVLLGRVQTGPRRTVMVEDYELIPCDYSRGPLYLLAEPDRARLQGVLQRYRASAGSRWSVVGFFRSNTRQELALEEEDTALFRELFPQPDNVFLLIKPFASATNVAGFFTWEDAELRERSVREFPFKGSELQKLATALGAPGARAENRAPVLPFAARREEPLAAGAPVRREDRAPVLPFAPRKEEPAAAPKPQHMESRPLFPSIPKFESKPAAKAEPEAKPETKPPAEPPAAPEPVSKEAIAKEPAGHPEPAVPVPAAPALPLEEEPSGKGRRWMGIAGALLLVAGGGLAFWLRPWTPRTPPPPSAAAQDASGLALRVERNLGQLIVTWNREATFVKTAQHAMLYIADGEQKEEIALDPNQLRSGSVVYSPLSNDVSFRLEVTDSNGSKTLSESVRVLAARPSPLAPAQAPPADAAPGAAAPTPPAVAADPAASGGDSAPPGEAPAPPKPPAKPFSIAAPVRPQPAQPNVPEPPKLTENPSLPGVKADLPAAALPAPPPPIEAPKAAVPAPAPARVGGNVQEPKLLRRREPTYPVMARNTRVSGTVRLQATIGKDGRVKKVDILSGHPLLRQAAADAVKQWVYQPSMLNGQPVDALTQVDVTFNLGGR